MTDEKRGPGRPRLEDRSEVKSKALPATRLTFEEWERTAYCALHDGVPLSEYVRRAIRRENDREREV